MKTQWAFLLPVLLGTLIAGRSELQAQHTSAPPAAAAYPGPAAQAQVPLGVPSALGVPTPAGSLSGPMGYGPAGPGVAPAGYGPPGFGDMMPATAFAMQPPGMMGPGVVPAGYEAAYGPPMGMDGVCPFCGGAGCPNCLGGEGDIGERAERGFDLLRRLGPYGAGGWCSPRWFDIGVDFLYLTREDVGRRVDFMSDGPAGVGDPFIVLSTDNLDFNEEAGFRFNAALQVGASSALEFGYFGLANWASASEVASPTDDLYHVFSDFGNNPPPQAVPTIIRGGFTDTDSAEFGSIAYSSSFDSLELDYRRRWMAPNCRIQGSWLAGVRYFRLEEQFQHLTRVNYPDPNGGGAPDITGSMNYQVGTANSMTGFQIGGDLWATLFPGVQVGSELKAGIYGNRSDQVTSITADSIVGSVDEADSKESAAFLAEAGLMGNWRLSQHITLRGGYQFVYVDGVALAAENFNASPPFVGGARTVVINDNGNVFYHGFTGGLEWMW